MRTYTVKKNIVEISRQDKHVATGRHQKLVGDQEHRQASPFAKQKTSVCTMSKRFPFKTAAQEYKYKYICIYTDTRIYIYMYAYINIYKHVHTHTVYVYTVYINGNCRFPLVPFFVHAHTYICMYLPIYIYYLYYIYTVHTCINIYIHAHAHSSLPTHTQNRTNEIRKGQTSVCLLQTETEVCFPRSEKE